ncbi:MAG: NAD(P)-dependent oxidoreductase [Desulfobacterales bacterium]|nr:NAD(P)-dependent oxidoreductase [Desulfobacterales bacterium]
MDNVGIIGMGVMGSTVAQKLIENRKLIIAFDTYEPSIARAEELGASIASSIADVVERVDVVLMFLPGPVEVTQCVTGKNGLLSSASGALVIIDFSTVDPQTSNSMAEISRSRGVGYLDSPVLGRPATIGKWALPVGGEKAVLDTCMDLLQLLAAHVIHVGSSGSGNKVKLLNQMMFGAINAMTAEMMAVSSEVGIAPKVLYETIMASQAATVSNLFKELGARIAAENYEDPTFTVDLLVKDVRLGIAMAKEYRTPPILGRSVELINEISQSQGLGDKDTSIMWKAYNSIWKGG